MRGHGGWHTLGFSNATVPCWSQHGSSAGIQGLGGCAVRAWRILEDRSSQFDVVQPSWWALPCSPLHLSWGNWGLQTQSGAAAWCQHPLNRQHEPE